MPLPLLPTLEVRLNESRTYRRCEDMLSPKPKSPYTTVIYRVSLRNLGKEAIRVIGKKWTIRTKKSEIRIIEGDTLFGVRPLLCSGDLFSFHVAHRLQDSSQLSLALLVRDEAGNLYTAQSGS